MPSWLRFLLQGSHRVTLEMHSSSLLLSYIMLWSSTLSPMLFAVYMITLVKTIQHHGIRYHCFADDKQYLLSFKSDTGNKILLTYISG